jgi:endonuclease/exonuclease/phosphatase family metal-dependent hydrolase
MRVMTFNLRFESDHDGPNGWSYRKRLAVALINRYTPSIVGTQEGTCSQISYLRDKLSDYHLHAPNRIFDDTCQYPTLFIRRDDFYVSGGDEFWLSRTPHIHRSKDWDSAFPRMMSYANLRTSGNNVPLTAAVTHLDHRGNRAKVEQANILARWVHRQACPVILMGDFNDTPESAVHNVLTGRVTGLRDTWRVLEREENPASFTYHGFTGIPHKARLDWILVSSDFRVIDAQVVKDHFNGRYPLDHFPYLAELELV